MPTKGDRIDTMYSMVKISGRTRIPDDGEKALALSRLETLAHELQEQNIDTGFFFEEEPNLLTNHRMQWGFRDYMSAILATKIPDFKGQIDPWVMQLAVTGQSKMANITAPRNILTRSVLSPIGSGNRRFNRLWRTTQPGIIQAPPSAQTFTLIIEDIENYSESYISYLGTSETITSFEIEADDGLTVVSSTLASPLINYQIQAEGASGEVISNALLQLKITAVTSEGRQTVRWTNFRLIDASEIPRT